MPIYEYQCTACGHDFEAMQKMSESPLKVCPACKKPELKKLISAAGFQLKGTGWYATDFKDGASKKATASEKDSASDSSGSSSGRQKAKGGCAGQ